MGWVWLDPLMGIVGAIVIARWSWSLMRDTAAVLLDTTDTAIEAEVREFVEGPGGGCRAGACGRAPGPGGEPGGARARAGRPGGERAGGTSRRR